MRNVFNFNLHLFVFVYALCSLTSFRAACLFLFVLLCPLFLSGLGGLFLCGIAIYEAGKMLK